MIAVIMCGGMGTRMRPITELRPKPLLQVAGREILDILIEKLIVSGVDRIYLTLGYKSQQIVEFVDEKQYNVEIITVTEQSPLGTAGGVRNAVGDTMEDVLVISGDNIFGYDLNEAYQQHLKAKAHVSIIGVRRDDPRDYGTICTQEDGTISSFIEKPSWAQVESDIINTGIYFIKGEILSLIPKAKVFDFANDLFPVLMQKNYHLHCITENGEWGDLGDLESYLDVNKSALSGLFGNVINKECLIQRNIILANGTQITAPCYIGTNVNLEANCKIGPYAIINDDCTIGQGADINNSVISADCLIGHNFICTGSFIGESCSIGACVSICSGSVLAGKVKVQNYCEIAKGSRIYPGSIIRETECNTRNQIIKNSGSAVLTARGINGIIFDEISISNAFDAGCAIGSCKRINRVGICCDDNILSEIFKNAIGIGLQVCGCTVYDFGNIIRSQRFFLSQYCRLDFFVSVVVHDNIVEFLFNEKCGSPVSRKTERQLQSFYRYKLFQYDSGDNYKEVFRMEPLTAVYRSYLINSLPFSDKNFHVAVECDNRKVYELLRNALHNKNYSCGYGGILFMIDRYGEKFYAVENERAYSYDRILSICCNAALADGADIAVGEAAPGIIEELALRQGRNIYRLYEAENEISDEALDVLISEPWVFDGLLCIVRLLTIMSDKKKTLQQLSDELPDCYVKSTVVVYDGEPYQFNKRMTDNGAVRSVERKGYYEWEDERGVIRIKPDAACRNIRVLVESDNMEMSRELSADAELKLKNCAIDKLY